MHVCICIRDGTLQGAELLMHHSKRIALHTVIHSIVPSLMCIMYVRDATIYRYIAIS